jgi:hypothetical protein
VPAGGSCGRGHRAPVFCDTKPEAAGAPQPHAREAKAGGTFLIGDAGRVAHSRLLQLAVRFTPQAQRGRPKLRFIPNIRFGTEGYPEKVARRLRAVNVAAWILAPGTALFAVERFLDGSSHWKYTALVALAYASTPLLHRFGPLAAPLVLVGVGYTFIFWVSSIVGTDGGTYFFYSTAGRARHSAARR